MSHIELLKKHNACEAAVEWASQYPDFATSWEACHRPDWMLWLHEKEIITISDRNLRLFACDCVRYTPIGDGHRVWDLLNDQRSRHAVKVAERHANGEATDDELYLTWAIAWSAWAAACASTASASSAAAMAIMAASDTAWTAAKAAAWTTATAAALQSDLLRKRVGNPFKAMEGEV